MAAAERARKARRVETREERVFISAGIVADQGQVAPVAGKAIFLEVSGWATKWELTDATTEDEAEKPSPASRSQGFVWFGLPEGQEAESVVSCMWRVKTLSTTFSTSARKKLCCGSGTATWVLVPRAEAIWLQR